MSEELGLVRRNRAEAAHAIARAKDWAARQTAADRAPEPLVCPSAANERQRAAWHSAMGEITARERATKIQRGWQRIAKTTAPSGCVALCAIWGQRMVVLAIDLRGQLRQVEGGRAGGIVTVSEAVALAAPR